MPIQTVRVFKRAQDNLYVATAEMPRTAQGKRVRLVRYDRTSKGARERLLTELRLRGDARAITPKLTLGQFLEDWRTRHKPATQDWSAAWNTWYSYGQSINRVLAHPISNLPLVEVRRGEVSRFMADLAAPRGTKEPYAFETRKRTRDVLRNALEDAVTFEYISENPASRARIPAGKIRPWRVLGPVEMRLFVESAFMQGNSERDRLATLWLVALFGGLRSGELTGLRWRDVDFDNRTITVHQQAQRIRNRDAHSLGDAIEHNGAAFKFTSPKSAASAGREVPMSQWVLRRLRVYSLREYPKFARAKGIPATNDLVWPSSSGAPISNAVLRTRYFQRVCEKAGIRFSTKERYGLRIHDLRHSFTSYLVSHGVSLEIAAAVLGHSTTRTTERYTHLKGRKELRLVANVLDTFYGDPPLVDPLDEIERRPRSAVGPSVRRSELPGKLREGS